MFDGYNYKGGFAGASEYYNEFTKCYATAEINDGSQDAIDLLGAGGFIGISLGDVSLAQCFTSGSITIKNNIAGLVGRKNDCSNTVIINNSYSTCTLTGRAGGNDYSTISGLVSGNGRANIINSYFAGEINSGDERNGLVREFVPSTIMDSFFDKTITKLNTPDTSARETKEMYQKSNYTNWDFKNIWTIDQGKDYPRLKFEKELNKEEESESNQIKLVMIPKEKLLLSIDEDMEYNNSNGKLLWDTDSSSITVDDEGVVKAVKKGEGIITVETEDGSYSKEIVVLVVNDASKYRYTINLSINEKCRLTIDNAIDEIGTWTVMDNSIATVTNKGRVLAISKGLTVLTAYDGDGEEIGQVYVKVK